MDLFKEIARQVIYASLGAAHRGRVATELSGTRCGRAPAMTMSPSESPTWVNRVHVDHIAYPVRPVCVRERASLCLCYDAYFSPVPVHVCVCVCVFMPMRLARRDHGNGHADTISDWLIQDQRCQRRVRRIHIDTSPAPRVWATAAYVPMGIYAMAAQSRRVCAL